VKAKGGQEMGEARVRECARNGRGGERLRRTEGK